MADWDVDSPSDSDFIAQYPANERAARAALVANFGVDHEANAQDANIGKHVKVSLVDQSGDPAGAAGSSTLYAKEVSGASQLFWRSGTGAVVQLTAAGGLRAESLVGTVPNARLSPDVPLKNGSNVFGTGRQTITMSSSGNRDGLGMQRINAPEDNQSWYHSVLNDGTYRVQPASDDFATLGTASIQISRSDLDTTEIELNATLLDFNGALDLSGAATIGGTLAVGGAATFNAPNAFSAQVAITGTHATDTRIRRGNTTGILRLLGGTDASGTTGGNIALFGADVGGARANGADFNAGTGGIARVQAPGGTVELNANALDFNGDVDISGTLNIRGNVTSTGVTHWIPSNTLVIGSTSDVSVALRGGGDGAEFRINQGTQVALIRAGGVSSANTVASFAANEIQFDVALFDMNGNADISGTLAVGGAVRAGTAATSTSSTLAAGQIHHRSENTTVPSMNAGQWVAVQNTSTSSITLSQGSGVTLELGGTTMTGNRTLLAKGFAFIYFRANGVGVVHGSGVS